MWWGGVQMLEVGSHSNNNDSTAFRQSSSKHGSDQEADNEVPGTLDFNAFSWRLIDVYSFCALCATIHHSLHFTIYGGCQRHPRDNTLANCHQIWFYETVGNADVNILVISGCLWCAYNIYLFGHVSPNHALLSRVTISRLPKQESQWRMNCNVLRSFRTSLRILPTSQ